MRYGQQKARRAGRAQSKTTSQSQYSISQRPCTCYRGQARATICIVCLRWLRLRRHIDDMLAMVTS
jgi:hypothetical protein